MNWSHEIALGKSADFIAARWDAIGTQRQIRTLMANSRFRSEADMTRASWACRSDESVESPGGISPPGAPKTVREPLDSHGSRCSAADERRRTALPCPRTPPVTGWLQVLAEQCSPFGPVPLQNLQPYYEPLRPCAPHRYSGPRSFSRLDCSLHIGTTGSHVPYKSLIRLRAAYMPDAARAASRTTPELVPEARRT